MKTLPTPSSRRPSLLLALAATVLAGCGGGGGGSNGSSSAGSSIKAQPTSATAVLGGSATLSVSASGSGALTYQWYKNGGAISGATSSSYTIASVSNASVATYYVTIADSRGTVTSSPVTVTLTTSSSPTITTQPSNLTVLPGGSAKFTVIASGAGTLTYQWYFDGTAISGATSSTYTIATVADASAGAYDVVVTNASGSVTSRTVTLATSANAPSITSQPGTQTVAAGTKATFGVAASGVGTLTYQWTKNGVAIPGATASTYSIASVGAGDAGSYAVIVSNDFGSTASGAATLTVVTAPVIVTQPTGGTVNAGGSLTLTVAAASGSGTLTYQWYRNGVPISGVTGASYTVTPTASNVGTVNYYAIVKNIAGSVSSDTVTVTVVGPPTITSQPTATTVGVGSAATFTVAASGTGTLTYQWYKNGGAISGATGASYTTPATTTSDNAATFDVIVTNDAGSTTSNTVALKVDQAPTITTQPAASTTVTAPATVKLTVVATASGTLSYQWYSTTAGLISGATSASYTTPATVAGTTNTYYVVVSNDGVISTTSSQAVVIGQ